MGIEECGEVGVGFDVDYVVFEGCGYCVVDVVLVVFCVDEYCWWFVICMVEIDGFLLFVGDCYWWLDYVDFVVL